MKKRKRREKWEIIEDYFSFENTSNIEIEFERFFDKIRPLLKFFSKSCFPVEISVKRRIKNRADEDGYGEKVVVYVNKNDDLTEIWWVLAHEITHHLVSCCDELYKTINGLYLDKGNNSDRLFLQYLFNLDMPNATAGEIYERMHDLMSEEHFANCIATMVIGKHFKYGKKLRVPKAWRN